MSIQKRPNGKYQVRWRPGGKTGPQFSRNFDRRKDAEAFETELRRRQQLGGVVNPNRGRIPLGEFVETYWRLHAIPNLAPNTRDAYARTWANHLLPRVGALELRDLSPKVVTRLKADIEAGGVGAAAARKAMAVLQSILAFAVLEEEIDFNPVAVVRKPRYQREREPIVFLPTEVEEIRNQLDHALDRTLVSVLAYSGPRPEEALRLRIRDIGKEAIHYDGRKTRRPRWTPLLRHLAADLAEWQLARGRPRPDAPVFPAHDGGHWQPDDWKNWRRRVWQQVAPAGSRPRDLRSSYITLRVYEGLPLTEIARHCGTSVMMLDMHYAGVIANWDGCRLPADEQIRAARASGAETQAGG